MHMLWIIIAISLGLNVFQLYINIDGILFKIDNHKIKTIRKAYFFLTKELLPNDFSESNLAEVRYYFLIRLYEKYIEDNFHNKNIRRELSISSINKNAGYDRDIHGIIKRVKTL